MNAHLGAAAVSDTSGDAEFVRDYIETLSMVERLHRLLLDVIKDEFERLGIIDINSVQALLLFNIGDHEVTAGELKSRGYYQGSNVSYNLKMCVTFCHMGEGSFLFPGLRPPRRGEAAGRGSVKHPLDF